jgi:high-affinity iron transporter
MTAIWNTGAFFVLFRESIEAAIVIGILLNFLTKTLEHDPELQKKLKRQVWLGALAGLILSIILGIILTVIYYVLQHNVFAGNAEMLWEGCFMTIACIMLTWMGFGMLGAEEWYMKWQKVRSLVSDND